MSTGPSQDYLSGLVDELRKLPEETGWLEFKENNSNPEEIGEYLSALSNTAALLGKANGYLVWGVEDKSHTVVGTTFKPSQTKKGNEDLENWLVRLLNPRLHFRFYEVIYEGKPADNKFSLNMDRLPLFTRKVLLLTFKIPRGYVATYGGIAEALGDKSAARAVGNVEAANPFSPIVPCHRVVASNLGLGGYGGGLDVKRALLKREGVTLTGDRVSSEHLWSVE